VDVSLRLGYNGSPISRVNKSFIFDQPHQAEYMERRCAFLVGCGVGRFSAFLRDAGFHVTAVDGREAYRFREFPDDEQFRRVDGRDRARTLFAPGTCDVRSPLLEVATEPFARPDRLTKQRKGPAKLFRRLGKGFRRPAPAVAPTPHAGSRGD
jgi:hypothetical protein